MEKCEPMLNQCQFIGHLGADPEIRSMQSGDKVANLRLAVSERWKDKATGERKEKTEWVSLTIWGPLAGIVEQYLHKGSKIFVQGKLQTRKWSDQSGNDRYSTEVVLQGPGAVLTMLDGAKSDGGQRQGNTGGGSSGGRSSGGGGDGWSGGASGGGSIADDPLDDSIPFLTRNSVW